MILLFRTASPLPTGSPNGIVYTSAIVYPAPSATTTVAGKLVNAEQTNVCKVKPQQQSQPIMASFSPPPLPPQSCAMSGFPNVPGSTSQLGGIPTIPSPPNIVFNSSQQVSVSLM